MSFIALATVDFNAPCSQVRICFVSVWPHTESHAHVNDILKRVCKWWHLIPSHCTSGQWVDATAAALACEANLNTPLLSFKPILFLNKWQLPHSFWGIQVTLLFSCLPSESTSFEVQPSNVCSVSHCNWVPHGSRQFWEFRISLLILRRSKREGQRRKRSNVLVLALLKQAFFQFLDFRFNQCHAFRHLICEWNLDF